MSNSSSLISLNDLLFFPYIDENGTINQELEGRIGIYAIFNQDKNLEYVGYSRNILVSLKQHLIRQVDNCYWLKFYTIDRPNRTILEDIKNHWLRENGVLPRGNHGDEKLWTQPMDTKLTMTAEDNSQYQQGDELGKIKVLKKVARRVEEEIKEKLRQRNFQMEIRFHPKLKEEGLLDIK